MAQHNFKVGDHVEWNSEAGLVQGTIKKKDTSKIEFKGYTVHASKEEPHYLIKSDKTDHLAMHKGSALRKIAKSKLTKHRRACRCRRKPPGLRSGPAWRSMSSVCCDKRQPERRRLCLCGHPPGPGDDHLPGSFVSGNLRCNRGKHLVPVFHKRSGGFALEIGGELVAVDARFGELCNHLFGIAAVSFHELTH